MAADFKDATKDIRWPWIGRY